MANQLAGAISPYLLQHADNPVDWYPWGPEAFAAARQRQVPILLSVGYAACHWCHVMAHESFEDEQTARVLNENFVAIKVDREEHPDVDAIYMNATQALSGQGGWPMTVFMTPDGAPFQAGTYYPPEPRPGMPSFGQLVDAVRRAWGEQREALEESAGQIVAELDRMTQVSAAAIPLKLGHDDVHAAWERILPEYDTVHGGFGRAPKFPTAMLIGALLDMAESEAVEAHMRAQARDMAMESLEAMARGGIRDQIGGGFHRYSVDAQWVVPHFEKMLYDNALLLDAYAHARDLAEGSRRELFDRVVRDLVDWLLREMVTEQGAFAASLDADSADPMGQVSEGEYYIWNPAQIQQVFSPDPDQPGPGADDYQWVLRTFHVTDPGTFEGYASTLQLPADAGAGWDAARYERARATLLEVRSHRAAPARDDKVVSSWNGWMISALVRAGKRFEEPGWIEAARTAATHIRDLHLVEGRLRRASRGTRVSDAAATLEDHGALIEAFALLGWDEAAAELASAVEAHFDAGDGGWWDTADDAPGLYTRPRALDDNATPSGVASVAAGLRELAALTGEEAYDDRAARAVRTQGYLMRTAPRFAGTALADTVRRLA